MIRGDYLTGVFIPQIKRFDQMFSGTVFPPFADPEAQAEKVAHEYWDQKMSGPCGPDGPGEDPAISRKTPSRRALSSTRR